MMDEGVDQLVGRFLVLDDRVGRRERRYNTTAAHFENQIRQPESKRLVTPR